MSYQAQTQVGFGRIFVSAADDFGKVAWALTNTPGAPIVLDWVELYPQGFCGYGLTLKDLVWPPAPAKRFGAEFTFDGANDAAAIVASNLARLGSSSFDITSAASSSDLGHRYAFTPKLGLFHGQLDHAGNHVYSEHQLNSILERFKEIGTSGCFIEMLDLLSTSWDKSLASDHAAFDIALERVKLAS